MYNLYCIIYRIIKFDVIRARIVVTRRYREKIYITIVLFRKRRAVVITRRFNIEISKNINLKTRKKYKLLKYRGGFLHMSIAF